MSYSDAQLLSLGFLGRAGERCFLFPCTYMLESYWLYVHWVLPYIHTTFFFTKSLSQTKCDREVALGGEGLWSGTAVKPRLSLMWTRSNPVVRDGHLSSCCALGLSNFSCEWSHLLLSRGGEQGKVVKCSWCCTPDHKVRCSERLPKVPQTCKETILWILSMSLEITCLFSLNVVQLHAA